MLLNLRHVRLKMHNSSRPETDHANNLWRWAYKAFKLDDIADDAWQCLTFAQENHAMYYALQSYWLHAFTPADLDMS